MKERGRKAEGKRKTDGGKVYKINVNSYWVWVTGGVKRRECGREGWWEEKRGGEGGREGGKRRVWEANLD